MKQFFFIISVMMFFYCNSQTNIKEIRETFILASNNSNDCEKLEEITKYNHVEEPVVYSYHLSAKILKSKYMINPFKKYSVFQSSSKKLDSVVIQNPNSVEIRFLRYLIQFNAPKVLGYYDFLESDYMFIIDNISSENLHLQDFITPIINTLNDK